MKTRTLGTLLLACSLATTAAATEDGKPADRSQSPYSLKEVVVTDTKAPQDQRTVTQNISTIFNEEFGQQVVSHRNLAELLRYEPGMFVSPLSRNDANWGSFGGLGPKYNSYLLDGLPIDTFVDGMSLDPWAIERVEVHRGPASVMYTNYLSMDFAGNQTPLAGITNFILRDRIDRPLTRLLVGGGSYNTVDGRFYHQNRIGNLHAFVGANYEQSDYTDYGTSDSWLNMINDPEYKKTKLYGKATYFFDRDDHSLSLFGHHTQHTGDAGRPNRDFDHSYDTLNAVYRNRLAPAVNAELKAGYRRYDRRWAEDNFPANLGLREYDGVKQTIIPTDLTFTVKHLGDSILTVGADGQVATYKTFAEVNGVRSTGNDVEAYATGVYLQEKLVLGDLVLRAGGRINYTHHSYDMISGGAPGLDEKSWTKVLWSAGARYNAGSMVSLYTNVGSSFVAPSAKQVGGTLQEAELGVAGKNGQLPNASLDAERGIGSDVGIDITPFDSLFIGVRGFLNVVDDAIVENVVSQNPSQSRSVNAGEATSYGVEISARHYLNEYFQSFANLTWTDTKVDNSVDADQDGADLSFVPDYVVNAGFTASTPFGLKVSPYLQAVGTYYDSTSKSGRKKFGPYTVVNVKLQQELLRSADYALNVAVDLYNITNEKYELPWQFRDPGFSAFGSVELTF